MWGSLANLAITYGLYTGVAHAAALQGYADALGILQLLAAVLQKLDRGLVPLL